MRRSPTAHVRARVTVERVAAVRSDERPTLVATSTRSRRRGWPPRRAPRWRTGRTHRRCRASGHRGRSRGGSRRRVVFGVGIDVAEAHRHAPEPDPGASAHACTLSSPPGTSAIARWGDPVRPNAIRSIGLRVWAVRPMCAGASPMGRSTRWSRVRGSRSSTSLAACCRCLTCPLRAHRSPPRRPLWRYEPDWDGLRVVVHRRSGHTTLVSDRGKAIDRYFPEVVRHASRLPLDCTVRGSIVIIRRSGFSFDRLRFRNPPLGGAGRRTHRALARHARAD